MTTEQITDLQQKLITANSDLMIARERVARLEEALQELSSKYRAADPVTPEELREHAIGFAYWNLVLDGCNVTREMIAEEYDKLHRPEGTR
jgi:hypothetical protein